MANILNTVIHGDMIEECYRIPDGSIDMILTDIPYGIGYKSNWSNKRRIKNDTKDKFEYLLPCWLFQMHRILTETGVAVIFCGGGGSKYNSYVKTVVASEKLFFTIQTVVWSKYIGLGNHYRSQFELALVVSKSKDKYNFYDTSRNLGNVFKYNQVIPKDGEHPTTKPIRLLKKFIEVHSKKGDIICDPFCGSGSTGLACIDMERNYILIDIDEEYCDMARRNIANRSNQLNLFNNNEESL